MPHSPDGNLCQVKQTIRRSHRGLDMPKASECMRAFPTPPHSSPFLLTHSLTHTLCVGVWCSPKKDSAQADRWKKVARIWHGTAAALCVLLASTCLSCPQPLPPHILSSFLLPWPRSYLSPVRMSVARLSMFITAVNLFVQLLVSRLYRPLYSVPLGPHRF